LWLGIGGKCPNGFDAASLIPCNFLHKSLLNPAPPALNAEAVFRRNAVFRKVDFQTARILSPYKVAETGGLAGQPTSEKGEAQQCAEHSRSEVH
jgi:hypothetical protein